jgi:hypothetical protein
LLPFFLRDAFDAFDAFADFCRHKLRALDRIGNKRREDAEPAQVELASLKPGVVVSAPPYDLLAIAELQPLQGKFRHCLLCGRDLFVTRI